jgi:hypothetical protein
MTTDYSPPPRKELPPERLAALKAHLLREIAAEHVARRKLIFGIAPARVIAVAATVVCLAVVAAFVLTRAGSESASAAEVRAKLATSLPLSEVVRGELVVQKRSLGPRPRGVPGCLNCGGPLVPSPAKFVLAPNGSYSSLMLPLDAPKRVDVGYDAASDVQTSLGIFRDAQGRLLYLRASHLDPTHMLEVGTYNPLEDLPSRVLGAVAGQDPHVRTMRFLGRPTWALTMLFTPGTGLWNSFGRRIDVVVDRQTGLVLQLRQYAYSATRWTSVATVRNLEFGGPTSASDFAVAKPANAIERDHDYGFRHVAPADAATVVGYQPLLPTETLRHSLSAFAASKKTTLPLENSPVFNDVVAARYGDGPNQVTVSMWRGQVSELPNYGGRTIHFKRGPLINDESYLEESDVARAFVNAFHDGLVIRVSAPSGRQAVAVAESLHTIATK